MNQMLPKYVSAAFGSLKLPWKPGHLRSAYGAICCHKFKPKNQTDDIFLAQILGHKLLGPNRTDAQIKGSLEFDIGFYSRTVIN